MGTDMIWMYDAADLNPERQLPKLPMEILDPKIRFLLGRIRVD